MPPGSNGQPARKYRKRQTQPQLDEHGQPVKKPRRRKTDGEIGEDGQPARKRRQIRADRYCVDPAARMESSEGVQLTRREFDQMHKPEERKYFPGGPHGGGKFVVLGTGVTWHFLPREGSAERGETQSRKRARSEDEEDGARKKRRKARESTASDAGGLVSGQQSQTSLNANAAAAAPANAAQAARAARLDQRLRSMGLPTRDTFESDDAFRSFMAGIPAMFFADIMGSDAGHDPADPFGVNSKAGPGRE